MSTEAVDPQENAVETEIQPIDPRDLDRYECAACGYSYEPTKGDDRNDIPAGVAFEDLPIDWKCPVCGAPKKRFQNVGPLNAPSGFKENLGYGFGVNTMTPGQKNLLIFGGLILGFIFFLSLYGLQ
ncbi:MAG TPA: rubredoxin [Leptolyngbya sp.]|jgi:rubredoxin|nr:rubredoxin [Leptolyngbya sp.]